MKKEPIEPKYQKVTSPSEESKAAGKRKMGAEQREEGEASTDVGEKIQAELLTNV